METVIGFAFGYWVGTRQGRQGMQRGPRLGPAYLGLPRDPPGARRGPVRTGGGRPALGQAPACMSTACAKACWTRYAHGPGGKVAGIRVRFGVRHAVDQESLSHAFESVAAGTEAADAAVELVTVPAIGCRGCGSRARHTDLLAVCPRCASTDVESPAAMR